MNKEKIFKLTVSFSFLFIIFLSRASLAYIPGGTCSDWSTAAECLADSTCCWSDHWGLCFGSGERCCHDVACSRGDPFCNQCPNDALDCYVCQGNNVYTNICEGKYADCQGKTIGDYCQSSPFKECDSSCNCVNRPCVDSLDYSGYGPILSCSLPNSVCQQGDEIGGQAKVNEIPCAIDPVIQMSITASGCSITGTATGKRYVASGPGWWYEYIWTIPQLSSGCLGKTATLVISSQGKSATRTIKLSPSAIRDNQPTMPQYGSWTPSLLLPNSIITYTAHAEDDVGLSNIKIILNNAIVKTCPVSGTIAECSYTTPTTYPVGTQLCFRGDATDTLGQVPTSINLGVRSDCEDVCDFANDTGVSKNYLVRGNCTPSCHLPRNAWVDRCVLPSIGLCCEKFGDGWYSNYSNADSSVVHCCQKNNGGGPCIGSVQQMDCRGMLIKYSANVSKCDEEYHDCLTSGQMCSNGACGGTCTPQTCAQLGKQCGSWSDGCTGTVNCGTCTSPQTCNATGQCVGCVPKTCEQIGKQCGSWLIVDGCTGTLNCGTCTSGTCNATGQCVGCTPQTCAQLGKQCGSNGCGGNCLPGCTGSQSCNANGQCVDSNQITLYSGWNMFSTVLKTLTVDQIKTQCGTINPPLFYNTTSKRFQQATSIIPGRGYWIYLTSSCILNLDTGITVNDVPDIIAGWNQIGGPSTSVIFDNVKGNCNFAGPPLRYSATTRRYATSTTLDPGYGYWVYAGSDCKMGTGQQSSFTYSLSLDKTSYNAYVGVPLSTTITITVTKTGGTAQPVTIIPTFNPTPAGIFPGNSNGLPSPTSCTPNPTCTATFPLLGTSPGENPSQCSPGTCVVTFTGISTGSPPAQAVFSLIVH